jgi:hypothetical protein
MTPRTEAAINNLRGGIQKMEESLGPLDRALRKFNAGRPSRQAVDTPLGAVVLAVEQKERLTRMLKDEGVVYEAVVAEIVTRQESPAVIGSFETGTIVQEGEAHAALRELEFFVQQGGRFAVVKLALTVAGLADESERARTVTYAVERSPEGENTLLKTSEFHVKRHKRR